MKYFGILMGVILLLALLTTPQMAVGCSVVEGTYNNFRIFDKEGNVLGDKKLDLQIDASCSVTNQWMKWGDNSLLLDIDENGEIEIVDITSTGKNYETNGSIDDFPVGKYGNKPVFVNRVNSSHEFWINSQALLIIDFTQLYLESEQYHRDNSSYTLENTTINLNFLDLKNGTVFAVLDLFKSSPIQNEFVLSVFVTYDLTDGTIDIHSTNLEREMYSFSERKLDPSAQYFVFTTPDNTTIFDLDSGEYIQTDQFNSGFDLTTEGIWFREEQQLQLFDFDLVSKEKTVSLKSEVGRKFMVLENFIVTIHLQSSPIGILEFEPSFVLLSLLAMTVVFSYKSSNRSKRLG